MSAPKKEILADLKYCKESLDRIIKYTEKTYEDNTYWGHHTVIQADIKKLRRELNEVNHKFEWNYGRENE